MRYDSIQNEWNICSLWGQPLPDFDDTTGAKFYPGDDREPHDIPHPSFEVTAHALEDENPIVHGLSGDDSTIPERFETEVLNDLSLYSGYTPLIPLPSAKVPMKESLRKNLCRSLGILWNDVVDYPFCLNGQQWLLRLIFSYAWQTRSLSSLTMNGTCVAPTVPLYHSLHVSNAFAMYFQQTHIQKLYTCWI